jgi:hypothetical protein
VSEESRRDRVRAPVISRLPVAIVFESPLVSARAKCGNPPHRQFHARKQFSYLSFVRLSVIEVERTLEHKTSASR